MNGLSDDEKLVASAQQGDDKSLAELLDRYKNWVKAIVRSMIFKELTFSEDLIQEGMIGLYKAIGQYSPDKGASFKSFATLCIKRQTLDALRHLARDKNKPLAAFVEFTDSNVADIPPTAEATDPEIIYISAESGDRLWSVISGELNARELELFKLYLEGQSYTEMSETLKLTTKQIDNYLQKIKRTLRRAFKTN